MKLKDRLEAILASFSKQRILVLGDLMLDQYWWGEAHRLSPEAPVPVLRKRKTTVHPGGAANTAANLTALGATVDLIGVIGTDVAAAQLCDALRSTGIDTRHLLRCPERPTTSKTRIVALNQHVVRVDEEDTAAIDTTQADEVAHRADALVGEVNALVISDYAKGLLTPPLLAQAIGSAKRAGIPVFVDPKGSDWTRYKGATLLKPNRAELSMLTGWPIRSREDTVQAAMQLLPHLEGTYLLVTEGEDGMSLFRPALPAEHIHSVERHVYDVTGAGDTVLATLAISVSSGATYRDAMILATHAAAVVVGTVGTTTVTAESLRTAIDMAVLSQSATMADKDES
jgi:rfaE bifunctional protein kinase chain/domain